MFSSVALVVAMANALSPVDPAAVPAGSLGFVPNLGQWADQAKFLARSGGLDLWVTDTGITLDFHQETDSGRRGHVVNVTFGLSTQGKAVAGSQSQALVHYLDEGIQAEVYREAWIGQVAPGMDARLYFEDDRPRYDVVVRPNADPRNLRMRFEGAANVRVDQEGRIAYDTTLGTVVEPGLYAYQLTPAGERQVSARPVVSNDGTVTFSVGSYDRTLPLVIDPIILAPKSVGTIGSGMVRDSATASDGGIVVVGSTTTSTYPTTSGAYQRSWPSPNTGFISKVRPNGDLVWSTYFGKSIDIRGVALDYADRPVICGQVAAGGISPTANAFDTTHNGGTDGFAAKLSAGGGSLIWATYMGGPLDDLFTSVTLDGGDHVYLTGSSLGGFPVTPGAYDTTFKDDTFSDGVIVKLRRDGQVIIASTYLGDEEPDNPLAIKLDSKGNVIVAGQCDDAQFPHSPASSGIYDRYYAGATEGFVCKLPNDLSSLTWSTFVGGADDDAVTSIAIGPDDSIVAGGWTQSPTGFLLVNGTYNRRNDAFVIRLKSTGAAYDPNVTGILFGGDYFDEVHSVGFDNRGNIVATGFSNSVTGLNTITTPNAKHPGRTAGENKESFDSFLVRLTPNASTIRYGSFLGIGGSDLSYTSAASANMRVLFGPRTLNGATSLTATRVQLIPALYKLELDKKAVVGTPGPLGQVKGTAHFDEVVSVAKEVALSTNVPAATVPASVTISGGGSSVNFTIGTSAVQSVVSGSVSATSNGVKVGHPLAVRPVGLNLILSQNSMVGNPGRTMTGSVSLSQVVNHLVEVSLASSSARASVPSGVSIPAGSTSAGFLVTSEQALLATGSPIRIRGVHGSSASAAFFDLLAPPVETISMTKTLLKPGEAVSMTVKLLNPAPSDGQIMPKRILYASGPKAGEVVPSTVAQFKGSSNFAAGASTVTFQVVAGSAPEAADLKTFMGGKDGPTFRIE